MSAINRLGIVWACVVAAILCLPGLEATHSLKHFLGVLAVFTLPPWLLLQGVAWIGRGIR